MAFLQPRQPKKTTLLVPVRTEQKGLARCAFEVSSLTPTSSAPARAQQQPNRGSSSVNPFGDELDSSYYVKPSHVE
jgi:hypothetical protein